MIGHPSGGEPLLVDVRQSGSGSGDLAADMASHGLEFATREPQQAQARDTQPVLIVTTNEIPGYRITQVHGDVFGLIVRARNAFSNMGAQLRTHWRAGRAPDTPGC